MASTVTSEAASSAPGVGGGRPGAGGQAAALDGQHRLGPGHPAGGAGELARVAERLQVEQHQPPHPLAGALAVEPTAPPPQGTGRWGTSISSAPGDGVGLDREPAVAEHLDHLVVLGQHLGAEDLDPELAGRLGDLAEQDRAQPLFLHGVGDLHGHLGPLRPVRLTLEADVADHPAVAAAGGHQPVAAVVVDLGRPLDGLVDVGRAGEVPQPATPVRQAAEQQPLHRLGVVGPGRPDPHRRAVPQHDVGLPVRRIAHHHHPLTDRVSGWRRWHGRHRPGTAQGRPWPRWRTYG